MNALKFHIERCIDCPDTRCLTKCQHINLSHEEAKREILNIAQGKDSPVLHECVTCYACEEYCPYGNHPFYLIVEKQEEKNALPVPAPLVKRAVNLGKPFRGEPEIKEVYGPVINLGAFSHLRNKIDGKLFEGLTIISTDERKMFHYFCQLMYLHYGRLSVIKERLPKAIDTISRHRPTEVICFHDECYGAYTSFCKAYDITVPFKLVHLFEYLYNSLLELKDIIRPVGLKVAYQRPCSSRLSPDKHLFVDRIFDLIGAQPVKRRFSHENALCCALTIQGQRKEGSRKRALEIQKINIDDMKDSGAQVCVFNCPACYDTLSAKVMEKGMIPIFMSDLCRYAIGEISLKNKEGLE